MMPNVFSSQYLTLDIAELRTPRNLVADSLTLAETYESKSSIHNLAVPTSNAFYGSFATVPVKTSSSVSGNVLSTSNTLNNSEFYNANYRIVQEFPSRIDKIDRLTISWRQSNNGDLFIDKNFSPPVDLGRTMFILRFETLLVPEESERPLSIPSPVPWKSDDQLKHLFILVGIAFVFLMLIILWK